MPCAGSIHSPRRPPRADVVPAFALAEQAKMLKTHRPCEAPVSSSSPDSDESASRGVTAHLATRPRSGRRQGERERWDACNSATKMRSATADPVILAMSDSLTAWT